MPQNNDSQIMSQQFLYPLNDPEAAFTNALRDIGVNPYRSNPFVEQLKKAAQGSRAAFLIGTGGYDGVGASDEPSTRYGAFLRNNLQGGSLMARLRENSGNFASALQRVRQFEDQLAAGQDASQLSPYTAALRELFRADNGMGALSALTSMRTPSLGALGGAYARATRDAGDAAMSRYYRDVGQSGDYLNSDPFNWLFASRGAF